MKNYMAQNAVCPPILFIRYNCDSVTVDGVTVKSTVKDRQALLMNFLADLASGVKTYTEPYNIVYINYPVRTVGDELLPDIFFADGFNEQTRGAVRDVINLKTTEAAHRWRLPELQNNVMCIIKNGNSTFSVRSKIELNQDFDSNALV